MLLLILAVDQDIIKVDDNAFVKEGAEDVIHDIHVGGSGIGQAEWHDCELKEPVPSPEGCLGDVLLFDADLVVA